MLMGKWSFSYFSKLRLGKTQTAHKTMSAAASAPASTAATTASLSPKSLTSIPGSPQLLTYGSKQCPWTVRQLREFQGIPHTFVNCDRKSVHCKEIGITVYPTTYKGINRIAEGFVTKEALGLGSKPQAPALDEAARVGGPK